MENPPKPLKFAPKIALAVCIGMLDDNYKKVAYHLNDKGGWWLGNFQYLHSPSTPLQAN